MEAEKVNAARSLAFIHLYLKVKFGLTEFKEREELICDGPYDGGIDAYYVDSDRRCIYFIQSKFRTNPKNFVNKEIDLKEILMMEIDRITRGETSDEDGNQYNGRIQELIKKIQSIPDISRYSYRVIILANLKNIKESNLKKLTDANPVTVFNFEKCYNELVFPIVCGTHYEESDLYIDINIANKDFLQSRISYPVKTKEVECEITLLFVSTFEIARILYKYKNSILKFNPRSYLDIAKNPVNKEIRKTIIENETNEFSLFNNGITMLSDETNFNEKVGRKGKGQLHIKNPQIINGGQTAYTLSKIYSDNKHRDNVEELFSNKEVMLKIITFTGEEIDKDKTKNEVILNLIEDVSIATNQQSAVVEADRRSNDKIQILLQDRIFKSYGYFYERKRGEFYDGQEQGYITNNKIIDRDLFFRLCCAVENLPKEARRNSDNVLFRKNIFDAVLNDIEKTDLYFFAYLCYQKLDDVQKKLHKSDNKDGFINYGQGLRYGKYAIINAIVRMLDEEVTPGNANELVHTYVLKALSVWKDFEKFATERNKNMDYFFTYVDDEGVTHWEKNFDGYYKGRTINDDLELFFSNYNSEEVNEVDEEDKLLYELV